MNLYNVRLRLTEFSFLLQMILIIANWMCKSERAHTMICQGPYAYTYCNTILVASDLFEINGHLLRVINQFIQRLIFAFFLNWNLCENMVIILQCMFLCVTGSRNEVWVHKAHSNPSNVSFCNILPILYDCMVGKCH